MPLQSDTALYYAVLCYGWTVHATLPMLRPSERRRVEVARQCDYPPHQEFPPLRPRIQGRCELSGVGDGADVLAMLWTWVLKPMAWCGLGAEHELARSIVFTLVYMCSSTLLGLPFSIYETFYLEQKHGTPASKNWRCFNNPPRQL